MSGNLPIVTLTPACSDANWFYSVSTSVTTITIGDYVTINPSTNTITIRAQNIYGINLAAGTYPVTVKYTLISWFSTSLTFNLIISSNTPLVFPSCSLSTEKSIEIINSNKIPTNNVY